MRTTFLTLAAAGILCLAACTSNDDVAPETPLTAAEEELPIGFDTYLISNSKGNTRAAYAVGTNYGLFGADELTENGFGIFAYLHDTQAGNDFTGTPDFMFDQKVTYNSTDKVWTYTPLKYWPNMTTNDIRTGNTATMTKSQYVSFFAYAPYIPLTASGDEDYLDKNTGEVKDKSGVARTTGITNIVKNSGDAAAPTITYVVSQDATKSTDLLWATAPLGGLRFASVNNTYTNNIAAGMPLINLLKPETQTKLKFSFQHALTAMTMTIRLAVDQVEGGGTLDTNTKVYVDKIELTPEVSGTGFATEGKLNLQNKAAFTPRWDKVKDETWAKPLVISETSGDIKLNPVLYTTDQGVTVDEQGVFSATTTDRLMFIPVYSSAGDLSVTVNVTYRVVTKDDHYTSGKVETTNVISNAVSLKNYKAGRIYNLKLVLGLTSVKIDAEAQDWAVEEQTVDLPRNL